jgi:flavin reductase (DIM6/NTAB) family NADH-FMN oxidoreductase RutF
MLAVQAEGALSRGLRETNEAIVHVPSVGQMDLVKRFFVSPGPVDDPPLHGEPFDLEDGLAAIRAMPCRFRIRERRRVEDGDHHVVIADVVGIGEGVLEGEPLRVHDTPWSYGG